MEFLSDLGTEAVRLAIGLGAVAALVWICGHMPRTYEALKIAALAVWGALSLGIPLFVFLAIYVPRGELALGLVAVAAGAACMAWPFMKFGWPALRGCFSHR